MRLTPADQPRLCQAVDALLAEIRDRRPWWLQSAYSLVGELVIGALRLQGEAAPGAARRSLIGMDAIAPALRLIAHKYASALTVGQLARACGMSISHLRRCFVAQLGVSPRERLLSHRIGIAAHRLESDGEAIGSIASDSGFQTASSFHRQFHRRHGCSPRAYRVRARNRSRTQPLAAVEERATAASRSKTDRRRSS